MVLTILWQVYMFLSAYESIQACQMMEELLGQFMAKLLEAQIYEETKLWSLIILCLSRSKDARKEQWRRGKQGKENRGHSCSLSLHFWSTYRSPFSTCYIPFQSSGSQESNALNRVRFGAEMRKIWPSEDNCSMGVRNFRTTPSKFAHPLAWCEFSPVSADSTRDLFFWIFLYKFPFFSL